MSDLKSYLNELSDTLSKEVVKELLVLYRSQIKESIPQFKHYLIANEYILASELSHKLKSSSKSVGALEIADILQMIESHPQEYLTQINIDQIMNQFDTFSVNSQEWIDHH